MNVTIKCLMPGNFAAAGEVIQAAFERPVSFQAMLRLHRAIEPEGLWGAWRQGRLVGTASVVDYGPLAYIGLMAVDPGLQRLGLGRQLLEHALAWLDARGCPTALLDATDKGAPLYAHYGFADVATASEWVHSGEPPLPAGGTSSAARLEPGVAPEELAAFDAPLFGACRLKLLRAQLAEHAARCLVARDSNGAVAGYLIARDPVLGPWAAGTPQVAAALLNAALNLRFAQPPMVLVPRSNQHAAALLERSGFTLRRRLRHMRRGGNGLVGKPDALYGQSSFGHG
jgi:ribosomal protein S18 acetylase RimI-like enzyme